MDDIIKTIKSKQPTTTDIENHSLVFEILQGFVNNLVDGRGVFAKVLGVVAEGEDVFLQIHLGSGETMEVELYEGCLTDKEFYEYLLDLIVVKSKIIS